MKPTALTILCFIGFHLSLIQAQSGVLDSTFGIAGTVITPKGTGSEGCRAVALLPDGKIVAAGRIYTGINFDFLLVFYKADGTPDSSYGSGGKVVSGFGFNENATALVIQPDGKIILGGISEGTTSSLFTLLRYHPAGVLDLSFGTGGRATTSFGNSGLTLNSIALQPDGKIVMAGELSSSTQGNTMVALARFEPDGTLDDSFGTGGKVTTDYNTGLGRDVAESVALQPDGRIVVGGWTRYNSATVIDFLLLRYNSDGSPDSTFGLNGHLTTGFGIGEDKAYEVLAQPDGKIVLAGVSQLSPTFGRFALTRYLPNGDLDPGFGSAGKATAAFGLYSGANSAVLQPDGKILAGGVVYTNSLNEPDFAVVRFNPDGTPDPSFGTGGLVTANFSPYVSLSDDIVLQPDGKIVQAGIYAPENLSTSGVALSRYGTGPTLGLVNFPVGVNDVLIYPNPLQDIATLEYALAQDELLTLALYDPSGKRVKTFFSGQKRSVGEHRENLNMDDIRLPGNYFLVLMNDSGRVSLKITRL